MSSALPLPKQDSVVPAEGPRMLLPGSPGSQPSLLVPSPGWLPPRALTLIAYTSHSLPSNSVLVSPPGSD